MQEFFDIIHKYTPPKSFIGISWNSKKEKFRSVFLSIVELATKADQYKVQSFTQKANIFARITPLPAIPTTGRGAESDSLGASVLWVDLDPYHSDTLKSKEDALEALEKFDLKPALIVDSGNGIHAYWLLDEFCTDLSNIKESNAWLQRQFAHVGADNVHDLARVMRIPGTYNHKQTPPVEAKIEFSNEKNVYPIDAFPRMQLNNKDLSDTSFDEEPVPTEFQTSIPTYLWDRIYTEESAKSAGAKQRPDSSIDRSANDWVIVTELLRGGYTPGNCLYILSHPTWFSGDKYRDTNQGYGYVERTVRAAMDRFRQNPEMRFFQGKKFVPAFLAEDLRGEDFFICTNMLRGTIYRYSDGVYKNDGEEYVRALIHIKLGAAWRRSHVDETIALLRVLCHRPIEELDRSVYSPHLVNTYSGMLDYVNRRIVPHAPSYTSTAQMPLTYDPDADPTEIDKFVVDIVPPDAIPAFWEYLGYCFLPNHNYKKILFLVGPKNAGKSTLLGFVQEFLGRWNVASEDLTDLANQQFSMVKLFNKFANINGDISTSIKSRGVERIKKMVGGDMLSAEEKYMPKFTFVNLAKLFFAANEPPSIVGSDAALFDRFLIIPCRNSFTFGNEADPAKLKTVVTPKNMSAALNRALDGLQRLITTDVFTDGESIRAGATEFQVDMDSVFAFWSDCEPYADFQINKQDAYQYYRGWCTHWGKLPVKIGKFYRRTKECFDILEGFHELYAQVAADGKKKQVWVYEGRKIGSFNT